MKRAISIVMLLVALSAPAQVQVTGYPDVDSFPEAVGYFQSQLFTIENYQKECSARYPDMAPTIQKHIETWKVKENSMLVKLQCYVAQMEKARPGDTQRLSEISKAGVAGGFARMESMVKRVPQKAEAYMREYCLKPFEDLASGVWRSRVPKAYEFMDEALRPANCSPVKPVK